jgi:hypothetical protein
MKLINDIKFIPVVIVGLTLAACATEGYVSELYKTNYGMRELNPDENVDPRLLMNGLYSPKPYGVGPYAANPYAPPCLTADYRCLRQAQSSWSSFDP